MPELRNPDLNIAKDTLPENEDCWGVTKIHGDLIIKIQDDSSMKNDESTMENYDLALGKWRFQANTSGVHTYPSII